MSAAPIQPVVLWSDAVIWLLVTVVAASAWAASRRPIQRAAWRRVAARPAAMTAATLLAGFALIGLLDSLHYRPLIAGSGSGPVAYAVEVRSLLDAVAEPLRTRNEKTYSEPLATRLYAKETTDLPGGGQIRDYPRLRFGGRHLGDDDQAAEGDRMARAALGAAAGLAAWGLLLSAVLVWTAGRRRLTLAGAWRRVRGRESGLAWDAVLATLGVTAMLAGTIVALSGGYHVFGTDKVGQDTLYQTLKSVRTALVIGLVTTLVTMPLGVFLGVAAGYFRGWVDDVIQYLYTTLNSIPSVLLIAASVLTMQVILDTHPQWFATAAERADMRLLALCLILGMTSWTGLARLLRGETLKLRELEYIQAAQAFGVSGARIIGRHILPNVMHIVLISLVMDFSSLVLAEAVLSYVGIGVDPTMISFGTMINNARMELAREPMVWWSLAAAFVFMFVLVLSANLFADAVRDAFDPRYAATV